MVVMRCHPSGRARIMAAMCGGGPLGGGAPAGGAGGGAQVASTSSARNGQLVGEDDHQSGHVQHDGQQQPQVAEYVDPTTQMRPTPVTAWKRASGRTRRSSIRSFRRSAKLACIGSAPLIDADDRERERRSEGNDRPADVQQQQEDQGPVHAAHPPLDRAFPSRKLSMPRRPIRASTAQLPSASVTVTSSHRQRPPRRDDLPTSAARARAGGLGVGRARALPLRREGPAKLTGTALYTDDLVFPGAWYGHTVRSTDAHARTARASSSIPTFDWSRSSCSRRRDIPGENRRQPDRRRPAGAGRTTRSATRPNRVALLAAPDRETLRAARAHLQLRTRPLPAIFDPL